MNKAFLRSAFALVALIMTTHLALAQVVWYGDPNKHYKQLFAAYDTHGSEDYGACGDKNHPEPTVEVVNDPIHGKVWKIRKKKGRKRAELARPLMLKSANQHVPVNRPFPKIGNNDFLAPKEGETLYYGWRWKISSPDNVNGVAVWQWKTSGDRTISTQNYPLAMGYGGGKLSLSAYGPHYPRWYAASGSINKRRTEIWSKAVPKNKWVSIVFGIKMSKDPNKGYIEVWFNGEKQTLKNAGFDQYKVKLSGDKKRAYHKTLDGQEVHPKWGAYNGNACNYDITNFYDEMRVAKSFAEANPDGGGSNNGGGNDGVGPAGYTFAADESETVNVTGTKDIAYGANGQFRYLNNRTSNVGCNNAAFGGDPIPGVRKKCYIRNSSNGGGGITSDITIESVEAEQNDTYVAENLLDGDTGDESRWSARGFSKSVVFDLGSTKSVTGTKVWTYQNRAYRYEILVSDNPNSGFSRVVDRRNNTSVTQPISNTFAGQTGRYVKLTVTGAHNYSNDWISINEVEITAANPAPAITIESFEGEDGDNKAANLLDGNTGDDHRWSSKFFSKSVVFDLGEVRSITGFKVWTYQDRAYQYEVKVSNSPNSGFNTRIVDRRNNTSSAQPINNTFAAQNARYVQLTVTGAHNYGGDWVSINEVEITSGSSSSRLAVVDNADEVQFVFPNPSTGVFHLNAASSWVVLSASGQTVLQGEGTSIELIGVPAGMYYLIAGDYKEKLIKQ